VYALKIRAVASEIRDALTDVLRAAARTLTFKALVDRAQPAVQ